MTDKRQKATKVKCKRDESLTKQSTFVEYSLLYKKHLSFAGVVDEHNTLPKSTRRNVKLNKFVLGTPWLPDILCKHWFTSSVWNFCRWVADVPPRETSQVARREETRLFSQANSTVDKVGREKRWTRKSYFIFLGVQHISRAIKLMLTASHNGNPIINN